MNATKTITSAREINDAYIQIAQLNDEAQCLRRVRRDPAEDAGEIATRLAEIAAETATLKALLEECYR